MKKTNLILIFILALAGFVLPVAALARNIYVDNLLPSDCLGGTYSIANRDNSGSDGDAYNTPQKAVNVVNPGDIVYFRAGTYYQHQNLTDAAVVMNIVRNGTVDNPITFKNYNNEEAIFSATRPGRIGHFYAVTLGISSTVTVDPSGTGVHDIVIDGLIFEAASRNGLMIFGPIHRDGTVENPTRNIIVKNCIFRNNSGVMEMGGGLKTYGTVIDSTIEDCEAYNNTGTGFTLNYIAKDFDILKPDNEMSAARNCAIRRCLSYNNIQPASPGNTDGIAIGFSYGCTIEDNIVFGNSDDGLDIYASIAAVVKNNIAFNHSYAGGNNSGIKYSAGGGGQHIIAGNLVFNNDGIGCEGSKPSGEYRIYYPSKLYANTVYSNKDDGFIFGEDQYHTHIPGFDMEYFFDNIAANNSPYDAIAGSIGYINSDYNFIGRTIDLASMQRLGADTHSLSGIPQLNNPGIAIDTNFDSSWTLIQKIDHIKNQIKIAFGPQASGNLVDAGTVLVGYHCLTAGAHPEDTCKEWFGLAPDIGAYEYVPPSGTVLYGDVSGDSEVSAYDAALTAQAAVGLINLSADQTKAADVSGDAEVSAYDAALIAQRAVGLIEKFPVEG